MKSRLRNFFMNSGYVAGVIVICGIVMDIGVNITKFSLVTVTESYMDYIYSAIITIAILSFSIIALIAGMFSNTYYGYKLAEVGGDKFKIPRFVIMTHTTMKDIDEYFNEINNYCKCILFK